jgi:molybdopterin molybdotransferase
VSGTTTGLMPLEEAQARVVGACAPLPPRPVLLDDALGCVTAERLLAPEAVPPFANSAMDGYALRSGDTRGAPVLLEVVGPVPAGAAAALQVGAGQAARIMTGAQVPEGADAVVKVEDTELSGPAPGAPSVLVRSEVAPGENVRQRGEDLAEGSEVFPAGTELGPAHIGVLASIGVAEVRVHPRPRVGVLSSGDELVEGAGELRTGKIRDSNRHSLLALVRESGFEPADLGIAPDDEESISTALRSGLEHCDAVLTSGGVSVGDFDYVKSVLDRLSGGAASSMQVAVKPAKPLAFGLVGTKPVFGLPGNPVSSMVSFELFARPALRRMAGHRSLHRPQVRAVADQALPRKRDGKLHLVRVSAAVGPDGVLHVRPSGGQGSHMLRAAALANALALVPDGAGVREGEAVRTVLIRD